MDRYFFTCGYLDGYVRTTYVRLVQGLSSTYCTIVSSLWPLGGFFYLIHYPLSTTIYNMPPAIKEIYNARAPTTWNIFCCPLVSTVGNLWRSITIYLLPCLRVLASRFVHAIWGKLCCCFSWPYEDDSFFGASALGNHEHDGKSLSALQMETETDWIRAHELKAFGGKRPQLFEGEIEPNDLCQGAVGDCWLVAAVCKRAFYYYVLINLNDAAFIINHCIF